MDNQVYILYTQVSPTFAIKKYKAYYASLPPFIRNKVNNYQKYQDKVLGILGKQLLLNCLEKLNLPPSLASFDYEANNRPFLKEFPQLDFNISHSGNIVLCAASRDMQLGFDIEQIKQVQISNFKHQLSEKEWLTLQQTTDRKSLFFQYWVKKEAVTKTDGSGLSIDFSKVEVLYDRIFYNKIPWLLSPLSVHPNYQACLATNEIPAIHLEEVFF